MLLLCTVLSAHSRSAWAAGRAEQLAGTWSGTLAVAPGRSAGGAVTCSLAPSGKGVAGTVVLDAGAIRGSVRVKGRVRGKQVWLSGRTGALRFRWRGRWIDEASEWRGPAVARSKGTRARGMLVLGRGEIPGASCGAADDFAQNVMPKVFETICAQCHVSGGPAEATRFRVTPGEPVATMRGPDIACTSAGDYLEKTRNGDGGMPSFPALSNGDATAIHDWVHATYCPGG